MIFEERLTAWLEADAGIAAVFGADIYPLRLPDPKPDLGLVYQRISSAGEVAHDGPLPDVESRYQFDVWGRDYLAVRSGALAVREALLGFSGLMGPVEVAVPTMPRNLDDYEPETGLYRAMLEFIVWHTEGSMT